MDYKQGHWHAEESTLVLAYIQNKLLQLLSSQSNWATMSASSYDATMLKWTQGIKSLLLWSVSCTPCCFSSIIKRSFSLSINWPCSVMVGCKIQSKVNYDPLLTIITSKWLQKRTCLLLLCCETLSYVNSIILIPPTVICNIDSCHYVSLQMLVNPPTSLFMPFCHSYASCCYEPVTFLQFKALTLINCHVYQNLSSVVNVGITSGTSAEEQQTQLDISVNVVLCQWLKEMRKQGTKNPFLRWLNALGHFAVVSCTVPHVFT